MERWVHLRPLRLAQRAIPLCQSSRRFPVSSWQPRHESYRRHRHGTYAHAALGLVLGGLPGEISGHPLIRVGGVMPKQDLSVSNTWVIPLSPSFFAALRARLASRDVWAVQYRVTECSELSEGVSSARDSVNEVILKAPINCSTPVVHVSAFSGMSTTISAPKPALSDIGCAAWPASGRRARLNISG